MKTITVNIFAIIALATIFSFNVAFAGEWVKVIEMGESGLTVEFPMTPAEIAAEKAKRANLSADRKVDRAASSQKLKTIEMGESGYAVTFKMTAEEIAALNAENARLTAIRAARTSRDKKHVVGFELAESGHIIEFPVTMPEKKLDLGDSVIAGHASENAAVRVR
jgi:hypothetical protein